MKYIIALFLLLLVSCSPYTKDMNALNASYKSGKIGDSEYFDRKMELMYLDGIWRQNMVTAMNGANASLRETGRSIREQSAIDAYNYRTSVLSQPVNVRHSGSVNLY